MLWPPEPPSSASGPSWGPLRLLPHFSVFIFFLFKKNSTFVFRVSHTPGTSAVPRQPRERVGPGATRLRVRGPASAGRPATAARTASRAAARPRV